MMKARADDRRIFASGIQPHVLAIQESKGLNVKDITDRLNDPAVANRADHTGNNVADQIIADLLNTFRDAKTIGSLIMVAVKNSANRYHPFASG